MRQLISVGLLLALCATGAFAQTNTINSPFACILTRIQNYGKIPA